MADDEDPSTSHTAPPPDALIKPAESMAYWNSTPSTVSGMLGGFPQVSRIDLTGSRTFLVKLLRISNPCPKPAPGKKLSRVADTGAGIGRITLGLLAPLATHVDVVEPVQKFTDQLRLDAPELFPQQDSRNSTPAAAAASKTTAQIINTPLESWTPSTQPHYDLIWNQWCLGHLTDTQLTAYLRRLTPALAPRGWIVVKENVLGDGSRRFIFTATTTPPTNSTTARGTTSAQAQADATNDNDETKEEEWQDEADADEEEAQDDDDDDDADYLFDDLDSSVTRSAGKFEAIFASAGLKVVRTELQRGFGKALGLYPVRMWGLQPMSGGDDGDAGE